MNNEQKQRAIAALTKWWAADSNKAVLSTGYEMAGVLQDLIDAPEPEQPNQSEQHLEMVNAPAPSVPVKPMENIALNEWLDKTEWVQKELNTFPVSSLGQLICAVFGHRYIVERVLNPGARKVGCTRCEKRWAMHDGTRSFVPWDAELEALYAPGGVLEEKGEMK